MKSPNDQDPRHVQRRDLVQVEVSRIIFEKLNDFAEQRGIPYEEALELLLQEFREPREQRDRSFVRKLEINWIAIFTSVMFIAGMLLAVLYILSK
jgi:hypothetical protein